MKNDEIITNYFKNGNGIIYANYSISHYIQPLKKDDKIPIEFEENKFTCEICGKEYSIKRTGEECICGALRCEYCSNENKCNCKEDDIND